MKQLSRQYDNHVDKTRIETDKTTRNSSRMQEKKAGANHIIVDGKNESVINGLRLSDVIIREKESIKHL